jgi:hypothetical protein
MLVREGDFSSVSLIPSGTALTDKPSDRVLPALWAALSQAELTPAIDHPIEF